jgi:TonB family protein
MKDKLEVILFGLTVGLLAPTFAQSAADDPGVYGDAILREWVQPEYPEAARQAKLEGQVTVEFVVEPDGHVSRASVTRTTDEQFNAAALAAVQHWVFAAALAEGKPVASGMRVPVVFKLTQLHQKEAPLEPPPAMLPVPLPVTPPKLTFSPDPEYPAELEEHELPGQVVLEFTVETDGTAHSPKVLWAPHAAFVGEALRTLERYRFEPAHQGPLPLKSGATQGQMDFGYLGVDRADQLAANHISVADPKKFQQPPRPVLLAEPVYPRDRLLAAETGSASVEFTVTDRGTTTDVLLREASQPEFGAALVAAVEAWGFDAAVIDRQLVPAKLVVTQQFSPPTKGVLNRLVLALQPGGSGVKGAAGLDQRLRPIWRAKPTYPQSLLTEKPAGQAEIEFIIDRDGRARLPRVVSASRSEFGWAAATAVSQWVFARPLRGGQPTEVRVSIPFEFTPLKD